MKLVGLVLFVVAIYAGLVALSGLIIMLVGNIILEWLGYKTMPFGVAVAVSVALTIIGGVFNRTKNESNN